VDSTLEGAVGEKVEEEGFGLIRSAVPTEALSEAERTGLQPRPQLAVLRDPAECQRPSLNVIMEHQEPALVMRDRFP
jgi:hypothetical protein